MLHRRSSEFFRSNRPAVWSVFVALGLLQACSTAQIDSIPNAVGGLPENAPKRAENSAAYPPVHDMPPTRATALLDAEQQKKLHDDLIATRNRQPNQAKNIAADKKRAEAEAQRLAEEKANPKAKKKRQAKKSRPAGFFGRSAKPAASEPTAAADTAGAPRNP